MRAHARTTDPETSHEAAASVKDLRASQKMIYEILERYGPMTDIELVHYRWAMPGTISESGVRTRRSELVAMGLVEESGKYGKTTHGRRAIIWRVKAGQESLF